MKKHDPFSFDDEAQAVEQAERDHEKLIEHVLAVTNTFAGRAVLWQVIEGAGFLNCSFTGDEGTAFNEGARNTALRVLAMVRAASIDNYLLMMKENTK